WSVTDYGLVNGLSAAAWGVLLIWCVCNGLRDPDCRPRVIVLLLWVAFNSVFHLFWGDECFLYSAHWAWALFLLVLLGLRSIRLAYLVPVALLIVAGQAFTLQKIVQDIQTIVASLGS